MDRLIEVIQQMVGRISEMVSPKWEAELTPTMQQEMTQALEDGQDPNLVHSIVHIQQRMELK